MGSGDALCVEGRPTQSIQPMLLCHTLLHPSMYLVSYAAFVCSYIYIIIIDPGKIKQSIASLDNA